MIGSGGVLLRVDHVHFVFPFRMPSVSPQSVRNLLITSFLWVQIEHVLSATYISVFFSSFFTLHFILIFFALYVAVMM